MTTPMSDFDSFAEYLGLDGIDADMFYEAYYDLDRDDYEYELVMEESVEYWLH